jgi:hypothetical protein
VSVPLRNVVWSLPGQAAFAAVVGRALGLPAYVSAEVPACDVVHIVGVYDCPTFATTLRYTQAAQRRVYHWMGPDAADCFWPDRLPEGEHLCPSERVRQLLAAKGIDAVVLPLPTGIHARVTPFSGSPVVAFYMGSNPAEYGLTMANAVLECIPGVKMLVYSKGQFDEELMPQVVARARVYLRLRRVGDGCVSSREYLAAGRRVVSTEELPFVTRVRRDDLLGVVEAVKAALVEPQPDREAAAFWTQRNSDAWFSEEMGRVL